MEKHELRDFFFSKTLLEKIVSNSELFKGEEHWNLICLFNSVRDYIFKLFWHYHRSSRTVDVRSSGIATLLRYLRDSESEVVAVNFNYDLLVEPTPAYKGLSILKPHGSINFLPSTYDPNRDNIVSSDPTYPFSSDPTVLEKNPLYFRNYADFGDGEEIGKIALEEFGLHEIELLPP